MFLKNRVDLYRRAWSEHNTPQSIKELELNAETPDPFTFSIKTIA